MRCWMEAVALEEFQLVFGRLPEINKGEVAGFQAVCTNAIETFRGLFLFAAI